MLIDLLRKRTSVRKFTNKKISAEIIDCILEAGRLAPSGGNEQPWKFGIITEKELINKVSEVAYNQSWIKSAPLLIVLCSTIVDDERNGRDIQKYRFPERKDDIEKMDKELYSYINMEEHQTKIPGTQMVIQALEYGIYSTWISRFNVQKLANLLCLPQFCIPSEIIAFGFPEESMNPKPKKSIEEITFYNIF